MDGAGGRNVWPLVVIIGMALTCVTILSFNNVDTSDIIAVLTLLALPIVGLPVMSRLESLKKDAEVLKTQTNGQTDRLAEANNEIVRRVLEEYLRTHAVDRGIVQQAAQTQVTSTKAE